MLSLLLLLYSALLTDLFDDKVIKPPLLNKETASSIQRKGGSWCELKFFPGWQYSSNSSCHPKAGLVGTGSGGGSQRSTPSFHCPAQSLEWAVLAYHAGTGPFLQATRSESNRQPPSTPSPFSPQTFPAHLQSHTSKTPFLPCKQFGVTLCPTAASVYSWLLKTLHNTLACSSHLYVQPRPYIHG